MTRFVFIGGFLGAGKTTLIMELTRILGDRGKKVGIITNDQAPDLVDTKLLETGSLNVAEVAGSCFCCDFKGLRRAYDKITVDGTAEIVIAEPVGSCTDLSATLINPIRDIMKTEVFVSPLTVLLDPLRLKAILADEGKSDLHPSAAYIIKKQLEESDIIAITKTDLYSAEEIKSLTQKLKKDFPDCDIAALSSKTGEGIEDWLSTVLDGGEAGKHIPEIDYDRYAEGEAVLGWLNCSVSLSGDEVDWDAFTRSFMHDLASKFEDGNIPVGHVKTIVEKGDQYISANLTGRSDTLTYRWSAGSGNSAEMIVNARIEMAPKDLEKVFLNSLEKSINGHITFKINRLMSISPGYPKPTYRYKKM
jgi:G3E family GTPase